MIRRMARTTLAKGPDAMISAGTVARAPPLHCNTHRISIEGFTFLVKSDPAGVFSGSGQSQRGSCLGEKFGKHASTAFAHASRKSAVCPDEVSTVNGLQKARTPLPMFGRDSINSPARKSS